MQPTPARTDPYQLVTDTILAHLERGVIPWRRPWNPSIGSPRNFQTERAYQGVNTLLLGLAGFASPWWLTYRQAQEFDGNVRKGERGSVVIKWGRHKRSVTLGDGTQEEKTTFFLKSYRVFNAAQIEGIEFPVPGEPLPEPKVPLERAKEIVAGMPAPPQIRDGTSKYPCYRCGTDTVDMPPLTTFASHEDYFLTLFHELTHATGHKSRLDRKSVTESDGFGGKVYSREELVAEIGAAFLATEAGIVHDEHAQSAAYVHGWLDTLRDPDCRKWIVVAASQAGRAADFILGKSAEQPPHPFENEEVK